ncbi:DUF3800 domain-containing protein [Bradyrhizobium sp. SZCCHNR3015]|uniref:DUF3800 domain-containing protein n=1 Tax=Bradyrhizobium sp. SZCCHNR3015 TaxID=3057395 RepID=UPI0029160C75|nr:DUF3800 domain-containing protein [Bradyrhizobium sp. SZCCHNR3015]
MAQWALYLDETGSTEAHGIPVKTGDTPIFTLGGVILPLDRWREYDRKYLYLKREFFRAEIDRSKKSDIAWEIKGTDLFAPRNAASERNKVFVYRVLDLIKEFGGRVIGVTFLKSVKEPMSRTSIYTKALQIIAERYDVFLREIDGSGILIIDSRMAHTRKGGGLDYAVAVSYLSFIFGNKEGQQLKRIIEGPIFADSGLTAGLQMADIVSGMIYTTTYRDRLAPQGADQATGYLDYTHTARYTAPLKDVTFHSANVYGQQKMYGLRTIDHRDEIKQQKPAALPRLGNLTTSEIERRREALRAAQAGEGKQ